MTSNPRIPFEFASDRPRYPAPNGKPIIVQTVVNIENWRFDNPMPRKLLPAPHGVESLPDVPNFSWAEYGMRCGLPRMLQAFVARGIPVSCTMNAGVVETYPRVAEAVLDAGWEFVGHGLHQKSIQTEDSEGALIAEALRLLRDFSGQKVDGWLGPGLRQTFDTPDLLAANGVRFCSDWILDDLPTWMRTKSGPMIAMPYSLEINDSVAHAVQHRPSEELLTRLRATLALFEEEARDQPRIVTLGLHPHLMGVPHRFVALMEMVDTMLAREDTIFMTSGQIADWFEAVAPAPAHSRAA
ncbi:polysaccharide deacetylase family protein [Sphingomonas crocodyli]|uniref:Uncharacterized protein n=1 Tax=Sphingomonas crocodyli TaxID=1979270 RepID=A0A437M070_9SPHN|nr:polysaccharide deacetylase family protein [Sphingomonas crocodyli]RVT90975.1 hypothetical protein EOD43_15695 [Sphingomonas crocodyli]